MGKFIRIGFAFLALAALGAGLFYTELGRGVLVFLGLREPYRADVIYYCPMHPFYKINRYGVCGICSMELKRYEPGAGAELEEPLLVLDDRQIQQAGVRTEKIQKRSVVREIDAAGIIDYDHSQHVHADVRFGGWVEHTHVNAEGEQVRKGDPLVSLYSPEVLTGQTELLLAVRRFRETRQLPENSPERLRAEQTLEASRERFRLWNIPYVAEQAEREEKTFRAITIYSPRDAAILHRNVIPGKEIPSDGHLFDMAPVDRLWVYVDVFDRELPLVTLGMSAKIRAAAAVDRIFPGTVELIEPFAQSETQTVRLRIVVENVRSAERDWLLKPGMSVRVLLEAEVPEVLAVPESAVVSTGRRDLAFLAEPGGRFRPVEVTLGRKWLVAPDAPADAGTPVSRTGSPVSRTGTPVSWNRGLEFFTGHRRYHEVLSGLSEEDEVVLNGVFLLHAEAQTQGVLDKLKPPERPKPSAEAGEGARRMIEGYLAIHAALARDDHAQAVEAAQALSRENEHARAVATSTDLRAARGAFGALGAEIEAVLKEHGPPEGMRLHRFECGMAKQAVGSPTEVWFQTDPDKKNPYGMSGCGTYRGIVR